MKIKFRIIAIVAVSFWIAATVFLTMSFFSTELLGGHVSTITIVCYAVGIVSSLALYILKAFPLQQAKIEEMKRLEDEYFKKISEQNDADNEESEKEEEEEKTAKPNEASTSSLANEEDLT